MGLEDIQKMYDNMYSSRYNELAKKKTESLGQLDSQEKQGKENFYNQRDTTSFANAQQTQKIRDYMAKNNLMGSGESVDAQLRSNTDFSNSMGGIQKSENDFTKGILDNRNRINANFNGDDMALRAEVDSQRAKSVMEWQRQEEQLALQREQMAMQREAQRASIAAAQAARDAAAKKNEMPTDPQEALAMLRMEAKKDPLNTGTWFATKLANVPGMEYVVKEANEYADNWRYYADKWGLFEKNKLYGQNQGYISGGDSNG